MLVPAKPDQPCALSMLFGHMVIPRNWVLCIGYRWSSARAVVEWYHYCSELRGSALSVSCIWDSSACIFVHCTLSRQETVSFLTQHRAATCKQSSHTHTQQPKKEPAFPVGWKFASAAPFSHWGKHVQLYHCWHHAIAYNLGTVLSSLACYFTSLTKSNHLYIVFK